MKTRSVDTPPPWCATVAHFLTCLAGKLSKAFGVPVSFAFGAHSPDDRKKLLTWLERINAGNTLVTGQTAIRNQGKSCARATLYEWC